MRTLLFVVAAVFGVLPSFAVDFEITPVDWLFIETADHATFADGKLVLEGVNYEILTFSDRPHRIAHEIDIFSFVSLWRIGQNNFGDDAPNAGLTFSTDHGLKTAVVELLNPKFEDEVLTFSTRVLTGEIPEKMEKVSLLVDSFPTAVNSQITDAVTQVNVKVLGEAPAMGMGNLFQATSQALGNAAHNATGEQNEADDLATNVKTPGVFIDADTGK